MAERADADMMIGGGHVVCHGRDEQTVLPRDVWVRNGRIEAISPSRSHAPRPGAEVIDARGKIVLPGFIDTHRHVWQTVARGLGCDLTAPEYRSRIRSVFGPVLTPTDVYVSTLAGLLEALGGGITTILNWAHISNSPEHSDAGIEAHLAAGVRSVFAHGAPNDAEADLWWSRSERPHPDDIRRIRRDQLADDEAMVTMAFAARAPHLVTEEVMIHDWKLARELGLRITVDGGLGGGMWGARHFPIRKLRNAGLMRSDTTYVHCNNLAGDEYAAIAVSGGHVAMSPCAEMHVC